METYLKNLITTAAVLGSATGIGYNTYENARERKEREGVVQKLSRDLEDEHGRVGQLLTDLGEKVTMDDLREAIDMIKSAAVMVEGPAGSGSGWITQDNLGRLIIVTNGHMTEENEFRRGLDPHDFRDSVYHIKMYNGDDFAKPVEFDAAPVVLGNGKRAHSFSDKHDIAILRLPPEIEKGILEGKIKVTPVTMADTTKNPIRVGDPVVAVGNPFRERDSVSHGIVSHTQRWARLEPENVFIQTNAPLNPGNSGCEVARVRKANGKVVPEIIGMHTWGYRGGDGVGGAILVNVIKLQLEDCGFSVTTPEELVAYKKWWKEVVEPALKQKNEDLQKQGEDIPPSVSPEDDD